MKKYSLTSFVLRHGFWQVQTLFLDRQKYQFLLNLNELQYNQICQILFRVHMSFHFQNHNIMPKNKVIWISLSNYKTFQKKDHNSVVKNIAQYTDKNISQPNLKAGLFPMAKGSSWIKYHSSTFWKECFRYIFDKLLCSRTESTSRKTKIRQDFPTKF